MFPEKYFLIEEVRVSNSLNKSMKTLVFIEFHNALLGVHIPVTSVFNSIKSRSDK